MFKPKREDFRESLKHVFVPMRQRPKIIVNDQFRCFAAQTVRSLILSDSTVNSGSLLNLSFFPKGLRFLGLQYLVVMLSQVIMRFLPPAIVNTGPPVGKLVRTSCEV